MLSLKEVNMENKILKEVFVVILLISIGIVSAQSSASMGDEYLGYNQTYVLKYATYDMAVEAFQQAIGEALVPDKYAIYSDEPNFEFIKTVVESGGVFGDLGDCIDYRFNLVSGNLTESENSCRVTDVTSMNESVFEEYESISENLELQKKETGSSNYIYYYIVEGIIIIVLLGIYFMKRRYGKFYKSN